MYEEFNIQYNRVEIAITGKDIEFYQFEQPEGSVVIVPNEMVHVTAIVSKILFTWIAASGTARGTASGN